MSADKLSMWCVYERPRDHPDSFVARRWEIDGAALCATHDMFVADTLTELRALLPPGLVCLTRSPGDEPQIVETWL